MSGIFELYKTGEGRSQLREIFIYAAQQHPLGLGASFLEKDLWVTEILRLLFDEGLLGPYSVAFKGGTSLSKCWNVINRFSEDIDLSIHWAELVGHSEEDEQAAWEASTRNKSQNQRFRAQQQARVEVWTRALVEKLNQRFRDYGISGLEARLEEGSGGEKVDIFFPRVHEDAAAYQRDHILLEFGGRNRGKPTDTIVVASYLSQIKQLGELELPSATVQAYNPGYILWEKITALHQFCTQTKAPNPERLSRHWYDVDCLLQNRFADLYNTDQAMQSVIEMKQQRWSVAGVDYTQVAKGGLRLVPDDAERLDGIAKDHQIAIAGRMFFKDPDGFDKIIERLKHVQDEFNQFTTKDN